MGIYLNPDSSRFEEAVNSDIYIDKTGLLNYTNSVLHTMQKYICISRPRRFGKSIAANMLAAYYSRGCETRKLFETFEIAESDTFEKYLNQYNTILINMQEMLSRSNNVQELVERCQKLIIRELKSEYPDVDYFDEEDLTLCMQDVYAQKKQTFVIIIDEWDCIFREYKTDKRAQEKYLDFLRDLLKDKAYIHLAYMTGILPIKKYGTHSALNMFDEFSMIDPGPLACYVGFTEEEVKELCKQYNMDMEEVKSWYDGYSFEKALSIYSPRSVVNCMRLGKIGNYWNQTETFEAQQIYIDMNFEGLKDDVLTLLIHLGYVAYDYDNKMVHIPNNEVRAEYVNSVSASDGGEVSRALKNSADTLEAIWQKRPKQVAEAVRQAHFETSHIQYNDENALSYTISLALYAARNFYTVHREFPGGKGFADLVFLPRKKFPEKPALVVELKWDKTADGAIGQIKRNEYCRSLEEYRGNLLLVGVNYDRKTKEHECMIEEVVE